MRRVQLVMVVRCEDLPFLSWVLYSILGVQTCAGGFMWRCHHCCSSEDNCCNSCIHMSGS